MAVFICFVLAVLVSNMQAQLLPHPLQPLTTPVTTCGGPQVVTTPQVVSPVVATTVVDNSVSNALANALQLLIVSNLIQNTMKPQCVSQLPAVASVCEPIQAVTYPAAIDCVAPTVDYITPYVPYDPIPVSPCDIITPIAPCEPIDIIPNVCYPEILPVPNVGCGCDLVPNYGISNIGGPNIGCGCDGFGPNFGLPNFGSVCDGFGPNIGLPNIGLKNIGYELLANVLGPKYPCDGPIFPQINPAQINCNCGYLPNLPVGVNVEPWGIIDSCACPNKNVGNGFYY